MEEDIFNISQVEPDPFMPVDVNGTLTTNWNPVTALLELLFLIRELMMLVIGLATIIVDILLIFMISKFDRLKTQVNRYVFHMAIMNLIYFIFLPLFLFIFYHFVSGGPTIRSTYCYLDMVECSAVLGYWILSTMIGIDWLITSKHEDWIIKAQKFYDRKFTFTYAFLGATLAMGIAGCIFKFHPEEYILLFVMPLLFITVIVLNYIKRTQVFSEESLKTDYCLLISTIVIFLYFPYFVVDSFHPYLHMSILYLSYLVLPLFTTSTPIVIFRLLLNRNKYFRMAFDAMFKKSVRNYESNDLDEGSDQEGDTSRQANCNSHSTANNMA